MQKRHPIGRSRMPLYGNDVPGAGIEPASHLRGGGF